MKRVMEKHMLTHSDEKCYECVVSHKKFNQYDRKRNHLKINDYIEPKMIQGDMKT